MRTVFYKDRTHSEAFLNPTDTVKPIEGFPDICISTFSRPIIDKFAAMDGVETIAYLQSANGLNPVYKISYAGKEIAFYLSLVGAPACVAVLEEVIAMGAKKFVFFGCCGILDEENTRNRLILPTAAVRDEGTSYHYMAPADEIEPDSEITALLESRLQKCGYPYAAGKIWTTDAIYRETPEQIGEYKKLGCVGVDMEYSALLAAAKYRKRPGSNTLTHERTAPILLQINSAGISRRFSQVQSASGAHFECTNIVFIPAAFPPYISAIGLSPII